MRWAVEGGPALSIGNREEGLTYEITVEDPGGSGVDRQNLLYYIGDADSTVKSVIREEETILWTRIEGDSIMEEDRGVSFVLRDKKGKLFVRACDLAGNRTIQFINALVVEQEDPEIRIEVSDPEGKSLLSFTSDGDRKNRGTEGDPQTAAGDYVRGARVRITATDRPDNGSGKGYSGLRQVKWTMVYAGPDRDPDRGDPEKAGLRTVLMNDVPAGLEDLMADEGPNPYRSVETEIPSRYLTGIVEEEGRSGRYDLYVWAEDFCGNGETPVVIPLLFDLKPPAAVVRMSGGVEAENTFYYRADNDGLTVTAADDRDDPEEDYCNVRSLRVTLRGSRDTGQIEVESHPDRPDMVCLGPEDLEEYFGDTEQEIEIRVRAEDGQGNVSDRIARAGSRGVAWTGPEKDGSAGAAVFIRDARPPVVTMVYEAEAPVYLYGEQGPASGQREDPGVGQAEGPAAGHLEGPGRGSSRLKAYTNGDVTVHYSLTEAYADREKVFRRVISEEASENASEKKEDRAVLFEGKDQEKTPDCRLRSRAGAEILYMASAFGTDTAGNPATVIERFSGSSDVTFEKGAEEKTGGYETEGCGEDCTPVICFMLDRKAPEITLTYHLDGPAGRPAYLYNDKRDAEQRAADGFTVYYSGSVTADVRVSETCPDLARLWYRNPGREAEPWRSDAFSLAPCTEEGSWTYAVYGTDRAGNGAGVTERFAEDQTDRLDTAFLQSPGESSGGQRDPGEKEPLEKDPLEKDPLEKGPLEKEPLEKATSDAALQGKTGRLSEGNRDSYDPYYAFVIDRTPPAVTDIVTTGIMRGRDGQTSDGPAAEPFFYGDDQSFYYKNTEGIRTAFTIEDLHVDPDRLGSEYRLEGRITDPEAAGRTSCRENGTGAVYSIAFTEDGTYAAGSVMVRGTDRAGNHLVIGKGSPAAAAAETVSQNAAETVSRNAADGQSAGRDQVRETSDADGQSKDRSRETGDADGQSKDRSREIGDADGQSKDSGRETQDRGIALRYARVLDRTCPVAEITHYVPDQATGYLYPADKADAALQSQAALFIKKAVTTGIRIYDTCGRGAAERPVPQDDTRLLVRRLFRRESGDFQALALRLRPGSADRTGALTASSVADAEGFYAYTVTGTDRAGNPLVVRERLQSNRRKGALIDRGQGRYEGGVEFEKATAAGETWHSRFVLVCDWTPPAYRFAINDPPDPAEAFDRDTGITYYGRSTAAIHAVYTVAEDHFDETRILAGTSFLPASGAGNLDSLSPPWRTPDTACGSIRDKEGTKTAVFDLSVDVNGRTEGVYRFAIAGCDRAGNALVPEPDQTGTDGSEKAADPAAATFSGGTGKGQFWSGRKAIDVTAPTGVLKIRSSRSSSDNYYELQFAPGGNIPVRYEPFRRETTAFMSVESEDRSPTRISFDLRSQDRDKDAVWQRDNPLVSGGRDGYRNDNVCEAFAEGEQVFYLENLVIRDRAGNVRANDPGTGCTLDRTNNIYADVTAPAVSGIRDMVSPQVRITAAGSFTRHEGDGDRCIYRPDGSALDLQVSVTDPGGEARSSGLKKVTVEVRVGSRVVTDRVSLQNLPYTYEKGRGDSHMPLQYEISDGRIRIPAGSFAESNDICIRVEAEDNSGNRSLASRDGGLLYLGIDTTAPRVEVNYTDTVEPANDRYFRAGRTVEVLVIDRNVDNDRVEIRTNTEVPAAFTPPHENRAGDGSGETGNDDRWTKVLSYEEDGDYTLQISGTDALGNRISDIQWKGPAPNAFTVDRTRPVVRILLPPEADRVDGIRYYGRETTAVVEVREHNFPQEEDPDMVRVDVEADSHGGGEPPASPGHSGFTPAGTDTYRAAVNCREDGDYQVSASCVDLAGNPAVVYSEGADRTSDPMDHVARSGRFVVDTVRPVLRVDPETFRASADGKPLEGLENQVYTQKDFAPRLLIHEINFDQDRSGISAAAYGTDYDPGARLSWDGDPGTGSYEIRFAAFPLRQEADGVYRVRAAARDYAGNESDPLELLFSVNRFGSTYLYADDQTERKMEKYYIKETEDPLRILEISPVPLDTHEADLYKDGERRTLREQADYSFGSAKGGSRAGRDREGARIYAWEIAPGVYAEEGVYDFVLSSKDLAGNENSTAVFRDGTVRGKEIGRTRFGIRFQVDKTPPVTRLTGVEAGRDRFRRRELDITVWPEDLQTAVGQVEIRIYTGGENASRATEDRKKYRIYRKLSEEEERMEPAALASEGIYAIEDIKNGIPVTLGESRKWQFLEVISTDLAGNESGDYRAGNENLRLPETRRRFLITANPLIQFFYFRPAFFGSLAGAGGMVLLTMIWFWKRRKDRERQTGDMK